MGFVMSSSVNISLTHKNNLMTQFVFCVMLSAVTFPLTDMNRSELQQQLVNDMIDGMDHKTMWQVLDSYMMESYDKYSDEELMEEVKEYYPHLLED